MAKYRFKVLSGSHSEGDRDLPDNPDVVMKLREFEDLSSLYPFAMQIGVDISKCKTLAEAKDLVTRRTRTGPIIKYGKNSPHGDVVETDTPLDKIHNGKGDRFKKFERLLSREEEIADLESRLESLKSQKDTPVQDAMTGSAPIGEAENDALDSMSVGELRQQAADLEIDLGTARTKAEIIAKIRGQMAPV